MSIISTLGSAFRMNREMGTRQAQVARLSALSDDDLAARGLSRDRIVQHVYRDFIGL